MTTCEDCKEQEAWLKEHPDAPFSAYFKKCKMDELKEKLTQKKVRDCKEQQSDLIREFRDALVNPPAVVRICQGCLFCWLAAKLRRK